MLPDEDFLRELTRTVWSTVLGLDAEDGEPPAESMEPSLTSSVDIRGGWEGTVSLCCPDALGRKLAAAMLECKEEQTTPHLIADAVGELTNVIGGNLKAMVPGPCTLSLPRIHASGSFPEPSARELCLWFACEGRRFRVTVRVAVAS